MSDVEALAELAGQAMAQQMEEQKRAEAEFRQQQEALQSQVKEARDAMMAKAFAKATQPRVPMNDDMQFVISWMQQNPRAVPAVKRYVEGLAEQLNAAIDSILGS